MNFGKILTAMVTPFNQDGEINYDETTKLVNYLIDNGTEGLVVAGTTGESPTLTKKEKLELFSHVVKIVDKRIPVIAGTGGNNTQSSIELTIEAEKCGVDAIMLVAPYYNKPNQQGLYTHFKVIAEETTLPIMLYNIPGRSVVKMSAETIIELSKIDNIVSVKEASGDLDQAAEIIENTSDDFTLYSGDDGLTLPLLSIGGDGIVSVASHVIGNEMQEMIRAFEQGDTKKAAKLHRKLLPVMNGLFEAPSPTPVKAALKMKGIQTGGVRLPLVPLTAEEENRVKSLLENLH
ncbi:4-hydroxy-tetrahydrodipicolinate synthase [Ornithinibacillus sp. BX22]|uniref:4-hydroxy-tetrahydrodipicolinate synthase n=2 Tax=Ornithinibacillus TaxID=484508 RepID=A0A923L3V9_9BACI|nr:MULTISPECIES: 4-hydroxy-tetrahydrodipicolinate synthase [Ornithinibacillus]MBC5636018.1 4-hydroxy-tetrahydrodipicolinate synthase [Ornithinibacillus hominis]MBS3679993.1 4-hydroxy-tetrahydrodipicolinate synthase [Ornithinibacillus massiliensis]